MHRLFVALAALASLLPSSIGHGVGLWLSYKIAATAERLPQTATAALVWLQPDNLTISNWANDESATGGTAYDLVAAGTGFSIGTINGLDVMTSDGSAGTLMRPSLGQLIADPSTVFVIAQADSTAALSYYFDRNNAVDVDRSTLTLGGVNQWIASQGMNISVTPLDTGLHLFLIVFEGDGANTVLNVSGVDSSTGNGGTLGMSYLTLFADANGANGLAGSIGEVVIYPASLSNEDISSVVLFLSDKWGIPSGGGYSAGYSSGYNVVG